jgi:transposase
MIRDYQAIIKTWFPKGRQRLIPTYGKHRGVKLLGILNYETGKVYCMEEERYDAKVFLKFLHKVLEIYPLGKIVLILDNARVHHAKLLKSFLQENERLQLVFLPPYSPKLNLVEGLWFWLKHSVIYNAFYATVNEIRDAVNGFIDSISRIPEQVIDRLCVKM